MIRTIPFLFGVVLGDMIFYHFAGTSILHAMFIHLQTVIKN